MIAHVKYDYKKEDAGRDMMIEFDLDLSRFERQYQNAQYELDSAVMESMVPFMPKQTNTFINVTRGLSAAIAGSGKVYAAAPPFGRFLYEGQVMVGKESRSAWAKPGEEKVTINKPLEYFKGKHPDVTDHWFRAAKDKDLGKWVKLAKERAGGG